MYSLPSIATQFLYVVKCFGMTVDEIITPLGVVKMEFCLFIPPRQLGDCFY
jgi:hypothetical protein